MNEHRFTAEQSGAINVEGSAAVRAGAGSGKTRVIAERYVRALREGLEPGDIVAMTFTEKAAAEMRERICDEVVKGGFDSARAAALRERLADAPISTIHGFCSSILREFPVEAGLDPDFEVADEAQTWRLRRQAVDAAIAAAAGNAAHRARPCLDMLLSYSPRQQVARMLVELLNAKRYFPDETRRMLAHSPDELHALWGRLIEREAMDILRGLANDAGVRALRTRLQAHMAQCLSDDDDLYRRMQLFEEALASLDEEARDALPMVAELADAFLTAQGTPRGFGKRGRAASWPGGLVQQVRDEVARLAAALRPLKPFLGVELDENDPLIARLVHDLWRVSEAADAEYAALKGGGRVLDFDDLEAQTIVLLESARGERVLRALHGRCRLVLVDEAQDMNLLQYRLVQLLARAAMTDAFIVGDPQQSIFAFRNADVRLFDEIARSVMPRGSAPLPLSVNFRSTPTLVAFANALFPGLLTGGEAFAVQYGSMRAHRPAQSPSSVTLLLTQAPDEETGTSTRIGPRAAAIARRIASLVEKERLLVSETAEDDRLAERPLSYGDVAVLLRTRAVLPELLDAFRALDIPYVVHKGIGFYQTQEVRDLYNCFHFLVDPSRDVALAGLLRSPLFALSDDALFVLAHERADMPLYAALLNIPPAAELATEDRLVLERARRLIPSWLEAVDLIEPSMLLQRILDDTGAWGTYASTAADGNLRKLVRVLRSLQRAARSLADVTEALREHIHNLPRTGTEPASPADEKAVRIMTVHAAKGLEFPVVFLVGLDDNLSRRPAPSALQIDPDLGIALDTPPALRTNGRHAAMHMLIADRRMRKELAELRRLLYVACTRAKDQLFLVGRLAKQQAKESWQQWIIDALGIAGVIPADEGTADAQLTDGVALRISRETHGAVDAAEHAASRADDESDVRVPATGVDDLARQLAPLEPDSYMHSVTVTELNAYARDPALGDTRRAHGLRFDDARLLSADDWEDDVDGDAPDGQRLLGTVVHHLLERAASDAGSELDGLALGVARTLVVEDGAAQQMASRAVEIVRSFAQSDAAEFLPGDDALRELPFAMRVGGVFVRGRFDCLMPDDPPLVVDYKLPTHPESAARESLEQQYGVQIRAYALAASRLLRAAAVRTVIVLPEVGRYFEWAFDRAALDEIDGDLRERLNAIRQARARGPSFRSED